MEAFHMRDFAKAKQHLSAALDGGAKEIVYAAKQHLTMCEKRLSKPNVKLEGPEDFYNYAISLYNRRDLDGAQQHFEKALKLDDGDHIHYALALVLGLKHDLEGAARHLSRAIAIQPRNRNVALNDPDFQELAQQPPIKEILAGASVQ